MELENGWYYTDEGEVVVGRENDGNGNKLIESIRDNYPSISYYSTYFCFVRGRQKIIEGRAMLWTILSPLHFCDGDVVIKKDTEVYHDEFKEKYIPYELGMTIGIDDRPVPDVVFSTEDERHFRRWTGDELEDMFQEGILIPQDQM